MQSNHKADDLAGVKEKEQQAIAKNERSQPDSKSFACNV